MYVGLELSYRQRTILWRGLDRALSTVGSDVGCDICIPDDTVAPLQAILRLEGDALILDNRAVDGTWLGDECVTQCSQLAHNDVIRFGAVLGRVCFDRGQALRTGAFTQTLIPSQGASPRAGSWVLTAPETHPGMQWELSTAGLTVGTDPSNDVVLDDPYVSRFHARFDWDQGRCMVRDLGSRNGVFLKHSRVGEIEVIPGAQVTLGREVLVVHKAQTDLNGAKETFEGPLRPQLSKLLGESDAMLHLRRLIRKVAPCDAPVLISGETGTGKELVAHLVAQLSGRATQPFVAINCGALAAELIASELFGHERGAFTGAHQRKIGAFEAAQGGTLFLDEVGELPLALQPYLLRVLETGVIQRVGSSAPLNVNVRVVAATHRCLEDDVRTGRFREDLFHRLSVVVLHVPPLRDRVKDIPLLARFLLKGLLGGARSVEITPEAMDRLCKHSWSGNVRELRNILYRALIHRDGEHIALHDIHLPVECPSSPQQATPTATTLRDAESAAIVEALRRCAGNKSHAAQALGVSRSTLHRKMEELGIDVPPTARVVLQP